MRSSCVKTLYWEAGVNQGTLSHREVTMKTDRYGYASEINGVGIPERATRMCVDTYFCPDNPAIKLCAVVYILDKDQHRPLQYRCVCTRSTAQELCIHMNNAPEGSFIVVYQYQKRRNYAPVVLENLDNDSPAYRAFSTLLSEQLLEERRIADTILAITGVIKRYSTHYVPDTIPYEDRFDDDEDPPNDNDNADTVELRLLRSVLTDIPEDLSRGELISAVNNDENAKKMYAALTNGFAVEEPDYD